MNHNNRFDFGRPRSLGDELLRRANRIKLDLYRCSDGEGVCGEFQVFGSVSGEEDGPPDMDLLRDLLGEFVERKET